MTTCVFPGQGSQAKGMGADLFSEFSDLTAIADQVLGYSIKQLCTEDPMLQLGKTQYTQPALYVVNAFSYLKWLQSNQKPHYVLGHSLGEYDALFAAGVFDFTTGLKLVQKRGQLMQTVTGGGMAAIIGLPAEKIADILSSAHKTLSIANYNSMTQTVITGPKVDIDASRGSFERAGAMFFPLNVSGAFHSPYLKSLQDEFTQFLQQFKYANPEMTVIANLTAEPYQADSVVANLSAQMVNPVQWTKSIQFLLKQGETDFVEVGPGKVLTGLVAKIRQGK